MKNKKLYYAFRDMCLYAEFLGNRALAERASRVLLMLENVPDERLDSRTAEDIASIGFDRQSAREIVDFGEERTLKSSEDIRACIDESVQLLIRPGFMPVELIRRMVDACGNDRKRWLAFLSSSEIVADLGAMQAELYRHFVATIDGSGFSERYRFDYNESDRPMAHVCGVPIRGSFHNHTQYSDGRNTIRQLIELAIAAGRDYIGISDHTKRLDGVGPSDLDRQSAEVESVSREYAEIALMKSAECEILPNGDLDLEDSSMAKLDYVIAAVHCEVTQTRDVATRRLLRAIENPYVSILAHPSSRLYRKSPGLLLDMKKIIDFCIDKGVAIEINGDPSRLDLAPEFVAYAVGRGAYFTIDADTHSSAGFNNINNAVRIAEDQGVPAERILNTFELEELQCYFKQRQHR